MGVAGVAVTGCALGLYACLTRSVVSADRTKLRDIRASLEEVKVSGRAYPKWLVSPPWSAAGVAFFCVAVVCLAYSAGFAVDGLPRLADPDAQPLGLGDSGRGAWLASLALLVHLVVVLAHMVATYGRWVLCSFTVSSWNLSLLHCVLLALSPWAPWCAWWARVIRFPMILFNATTFLIWWGALFPLGMAFLKGKARTGFLEMQVKYGLVNVHFLNLPIALGQALLLAPGRGPFGFFDLWAAFALGFVYLAFYLSYLEPRGVHFYIILSPRTSLCLVVYPCICALFAGIWTVTNLVITHHLPASTDLLPPDLVKSLVEAMLHPHFLPRS